MLPDEQQIVRILAESGEPMYPSQIAESSNTELASGTDYKAGEVIKHLQSLGEHVIQVSGSLDAEAFAFPFWNGDAVVIENLLLYRLSPCPGCMHYELVLQFRASKTQRWANVFQRMFINPMREISTRISEPTHSLSILLAPPNPASRLAFDTSPRIKRSVGRNPELLQSGIHSMKRIFTSILAFSGVS
jgi:hypothetical protein